MSHKDPKWDGPLEIEPIRELVDHPVMNAELLRNAVKNLLVEVEKEREAIKELLLLIVDLKKEKLILEEKYKELEKEVPISCNAGVGD